MHEKETCIKRRTDNENSYRREREKYKGRGERGSKDIHKIKRDKETIYLELVS